MKYGFIGVGNMAGAILEGILRSGVTEPSAVYAYDVNESRLTEVAGAQGFTALSSAVDVASAADTIILGVKPHMLESVISAIRDTIRERKPMPLVISIAAGKTLSFLEGAFGFAPPLIRVMPNINALVGEGMAAICQNSAATSQDFETALQIFASVGQAVALPESSFSTFVGLAGSSPAYVYLFIDAMAHAGVKAGLDKATATRLAAQAVLGSAKTVLESGRHPWELADMVCSPGGTTIEGVSSLLHNRFEAVVMDAVEAAILKDKQL